MPAVFGHFSDRARRDLDSVEAYLDASMAGDPDRAANSVAHRWVKKRIERYDVIAAGEETVVYSLGTLHGVWPDGTPFEGNRHVDRFVVRDGLILETDVWNDSAEWILDPTCAK